MTQIDGAMRSKTTTDGTHRACSPAETVTNVLSIAERLGVTRVADVTGLDHVGIPVVMVVRPLGATLSVAQGKGISLDHAKASGLMEAIELLHAEGVTATEMCALGVDFSSLETSVLARLRYKPKPHCDPRADLVPLYPALDMLTGNVIRMPVDAVRLDHRRSATPYLGLSMTSNGLASGNTPDEATAHALCEVIEREAVLRWHESSWAQRRSWRVDLSSVDDPNCQDLIRRFDAADIAVAVWDISTAGVAAFHCTIVDRHPQPVRPVGSASGSGAHPSKAIALSRALTEAAQSRLTGISGARDDVLPSWYRIGTDAGYLDGIRSLVAGAQGVRRFVEAPEHYATTSAGDVEFLIEKLEAFGAHEVLVADLTREDFGVPVVKAIVPGLRSVGTVGWRLGDPEPVHDLERDHRVSQVVRTCAQGVISTPREDAKPRHREPTRIVFAGPTVTPAEVAARCPGAVCAGPAQSGDVLAATDAGFDTIVLIDGRYDLVGAVWHKEILAAMNQGITVVGCASMGALRAAELQPYGMIGRGRVFERLLSDGLDDDDVAVAHAGFDDGYIAFNVAAVELTATVEVCVAKGLMTDSEADLLEAATKSLFYADRSVGQIMQAATRRGLVPERCIEIRNMLRAEWVPQKRLDALDALDLLPQIEASHVPVDFVLPWTSHLDDLRAETAGRFSAASEIDAGTVLSAT